MGQRIAQQAGLSRRTLNRVLKHLKAEPRNLDLARRSEATSMPLPAICCTRILRSGAASCVSRTVTGDRRDSVEGTD